MKIRQQLVYKYTHPALKQTVLKLFHRNIEKNEDFYLLGHNVVQPAESQPTFQRNITASP
jgi:hypothetical protein